MAAPAAACRSNRGCSDRCWSRGRCGAGCRANRACCRRGANRDRPSSDASTTHGGSHRTQAGWRSFSGPIRPIWDGRFANNGWLQELPKPLTKVTWDPTAWISPQLAKDRGLRDGDVIELKYRGNTA